MSWRYIDDGDDSTIDSLIPPRPDQKNILYQDKIKEINTKLIDCDDRYHGVYLYYEQLEYLSQYYANFGWKFVHDLDDYYYIEPITS